MTINGLATDALLTAAINWVADTLAACDFATCMTARWHSQPDKLMCCECDGLTASYTVIGWVNYSYEVDGGMNEVSGGACRSLQATEMGFTVARCWPVPSTTLRVGDVRDTAAAELAQVLDCINAGLDRCVEFPASFLSSCSKFRRTGLRPQRVATSETFGTDGDALGNIKTACAGWGWSITIA